MQTRFLFQIRNSNKEKFLNNVYIYHLFKSEKRILISTSYQEYIGVNVEKKFIQNNNNSNNKNF